MVKEKSNETPTLEKLWHINPRKPLHPLPAAYTTLVIVMSETNPAILTQGKAPTRPNDDGPGGGLADYARAIARSRGGRRLSALLQNDGFQGGGCAVSRVVG